MTRRKRRPAGLWVVEESDARRDVWGSQTIWNTRTAAEIDLRAWRKIATTQQHFRLVRYERVEPKE